MDATPLDETPARKRQKSSKPKFKHLAKLLTLAAEGKDHKLRKLLERHTELDVNSYNSDGFTALHQARGKAMQSPKLLFSSLALAYCTVLTVDKTS